MDSKGHACCNVAAITIVRIVRVDKTAVNVTDYVVLWHEDSSKRKPEASYQNSSVTVPGGAASLGPVLHSRKWYGVLALCAVTFYIYYMS